MQEGKHLYEFGPFRLDPAERSLLRDGKAVPLTPKAFELLVLLVENRGHLLKKDELIERVWPNTFVEEANLAQNVSALRKALDDKNGGAQYIETVPKGGYRFTAAVGDHTPAAGVESPAVEPRALGLPRESHADMYSPSWLSRPWRSHSCLYFSGASSVGAGRARPVSHGFSPWPCYRSTISRMIRSRNISAMA